MAVELLDTLASRVSSAKSGYKKLKKAGANKKEVKAARRAYKKLKRELKAAKGETKTKKRARTEIEQSPTSAKKLKGDDPTPSAVEFETFEDTEFS